MFKTHILFVGLHHKLGGIETYMYKVLQYIDLSKFQIDFLVFNGVKPCFYNEFLTMGCKFHFVTSRKENPFKNRAEIRTLLKREKFDIVHCHLNTLSYIVPVVEACRLGIMTVTHSHNASIKANLVSRFLHCVNYFRLKRLPVKRIAVSDLAGQWMFGKKDFIILNNGVETERFFYSEKVRDEIRTELKIGNNVDVFLNVSAFRPQKNHKFIINIFAEYLKKNSSAILLLVGDGDLKSEIEELVCFLGIQRNVKFLGVRNDIPEIMFAADKFIFPSYYEGFPIALIEAQCSGLYCIVADTITRQAVFEEMCVSLPLNAPISDWLSSMSKKRNAFKREDAVLVIKKHELDIGSQIRHLSKTYMDLLKA